MVSTLCPFWPFLELSPLPVQTSVFTPTYGSVTNVRVNSTMTTLKVLTLLLNKFRVSLAMHGLIPVGGGLPAFVVVFVDIASEGW